jgi:hypothetical protein
MAIKPSTYYNEPRTARRGDRVPKLARTVTRGLDRVVRARLEIEGALRVCGNEREPTFGLRAVHVQVLVAMLSEADSPLSASLRARAAAAAGPLKLSKAAPALRAIALNEDEDLLTRLNAAGSYVQIRGRRAAADVKTLLRPSQDPMVRASVYVAALKAGDTLAEVAERRFRTELDSRVKAYVARRVPRLRDSGLTKAD